MKKTFYLLLLILTFSFSCQEQEKYEKSTLNTEQFAIELKSTLNKVANQIRIHNADFSNKELVTESARAIFGQDSDDFKRFNENYSRNLFSNSNARVASNIELSDFELNLALRNYEILRQSITPLEYQNDLEKLLNDIIDGDDSATNKNIAITYLSAEIVGIDIIKENINLFIPQVDTTVSNGRAYPSDGDNAECYAHTSLPPECESDWWNDWGKCAAGVIGSTGTGLLGGAAIGTAVPVIGTVAGGIIGALSGGLTGAATFCGGNGSGGSGGYEKGCVEEDANGNCPGHPMYFKH
jgi:hypothetical protein